MLSHQNGKDVLTYVVYSGNIKNPANTLKTGMTELGKSLINEGIEKGKE